MSDGDVWCTIESDPGVFTELIESIGVRDVEVQEIVSLDVDEMRRFEPVYGLIFLFKWRQEQDARAVLSPAETLSHSVFFADQILQNACATQALLAILLNAESRGVDIGDELRQFKQFTADFPSDVKGLAISNQPLIRRAHNSFRKADTSFIFDKDKDDKGPSEDVFHFISYVPVGNHVFEIDGLKRGPILLGECADGNWLDVVRPHIQERIERYSSGEIRFNLMAMSRSRLSILQERCDKLQAQLDAKLGTAACGIEKEQQNSMIDDDDSDSDSDSTSASSSSSSSSSSESSLSTDALQKQVADAQAEIDAEKDKRHRWRLENIRRRHDYIPFIIQMLTALAQKGHLQGLVDKQSH